MKIHSLIPKKLIIATSVLCGSLSCTSAATSYTWQDWSNPTISTATATTTSSSGTVILSVSGPSTQINNFPVQFVSDLTTSPSAVPNHFSNASEDWSFSLEFYSYTTTQGVVLGLGNIGASANYRVTAFGPLGVPMSLSGFSVIGNFDYHWNSLAGVFFNDDLSLNLATGNLARATVAGGNDLNSDMLLMMLPDGVETIRVATIAPGGGDSINVMIGAIPEPTTASLGLVALGLLARRRRSNA